MQKIFLLLFISVWLSAAAADPAVIAGRAGRAYDAGEWASAQALYNLLADSRPDDAEAYARSIVAGEMYGDSAAALPVVERALHAAVPFDSLMDAVEEANTRQGRSGDYVWLLHSIEKNLPWLRRPVYKRLLDYYQFRRDPQMCIRYCRLLLSGMPDNTSWLNSLASAQAMAGDLAQAEATWREVLDLDPDNFDALVGLGNTLLPDNREAAVELLNRACRLHPTPYLESLLAP